MLMFHALFIFDVDARFPPLCRYVATFADDTPALMLTPIFQRCRRRCRVTDTLTLMPDA